MSYYKIKYLYSLHSFQIMKPSLALIKIKDDVFIEKWIEYCSNKEIPYKIIEKIDSSIIEKIRKYDGVLWHWDLSDFQHYIIAKEFFQIVDIFLKMPVFPNYKTVWYYDDKIAQDLLLSALDINKPRSWIFFNKREAIKWVEKIEFPIVFKLRKGSGSQNVKLIEDKHSAKRMISRMFGKGIKPQLVTLKIAREKKILSRIKEKGIINSIKYFISSAKFPKEKGYVFFQEFIPNCDRDYRIIVLNKEIAYGFIRFTRKNDFRASGSGKFLIDHTQIDINMVKTSFEIADKMDLQIICLDFIKSQDEIYLLEISYDFVPSGGTYNSKWHGFWDRELKWIKKEVDPVIYIIENLIQNIRKKGNLGENKL